GPMRIMVPQPHHREEGDGVNVYSEEEEEEEEINFPVVEEEVEREQGGGEENLLALIPFLNASDENLSVTANELTGSNFREDQVDDSNQEESAGGPANSSTYQHNTQEGVNNSPALSKDV
ncbi:hypothetical protein L195_g060476, partial [Trifolium pratense]